MKKLGIILLSYVFVLAACSDRQENVADKGPVKYDVGTGDMPVTPPPDGPVAPPDDMPLPPPDMPVVPDDMPIAPPDLPPIPPDGPVMPPDLPPIPADGPVIPPTDGPVVPPTDGPVVPPADGPMVTPDQMIKPDLGPPLNNKCANAKTLSLGTAKKVTVTGTTAGMGNEYGTGINCGNYSTIFGGSQVYYKVAFTAGKSYRLTMASKYNYAHFYVFQKCGVTNINTACGSSGKTGVVSNYINNNQTGSMIFKPTTGGTYYVAVDGRYSQYSGAFSLTVEEFVPHVNDVCAKATKLTLTNGTVTVKGNTTGAKNEYGTSIGCNSGNLGFDAPQLYYKVSMTAGTTYDIYLKPSFTYANVYVFRSSSCGTATNINNDCAGGSAANGANDNYVGTNGETLKFTPSKSGDYTIAVDGRRPQDFGAFTLTVTEFKKPTNGTCKTAQALSFKAGKVTVNGDTTGIANEFGSQIRCGLSGYNPAQDGPQAYYKIFLAGTKQYKIILTSQFYYARVYLYRNTCDPTKINADCSSNGKTGDISGSISNGSGSLTFKPTAGGTYYLAVDSNGTSSYYQGKFTLSIEEYIPPTHGACAKAKAVTMSGTKVTVSGDTTGMTNEFGTQINCGSTSTSYIFDGYQQYYSVNLTGGQTYKFTLDNKFSRAGLYIFGNTCSPTTINSHCGSSGKTGNVLHRTSSASTASVLFKPAKTGTYKFAVDSYATSSSYYYGLYNVIIEKWAPASNFKCTTATAVTLGSGTTSLKGDTTGMSNEYGSAINCGNLSTTYTGPQAYYKMTLTAGKSYTFTLSPSYHYARFYIFTLLGGNCGISPINNTCSGNGNYGAHSNNIYSGQSGTVTFTPKLTRTYYVAVDATSPTRNGAYTLTIQ